MKLVLLLMLSLERELAAASAPATAVEPLFLQALELRVAGCSSTERVLVHLVEQED